MAIVSGKVLIWVRIAVITFLAFELMANPDAVLGNSGVVVLASAMHLPILTYNEKSQVYGSIGVVLLALMLCDLSSILDGNTKYFETAVFVRLLFFLVLSVYCCMGSAPMVCNSLVFAYAFLETWFGILTFSTLRDERYKHNQKMTLKFEEMKEKYDRGELDKKKAEVYEKMLDQAEFEKIMAEFQ